MQDTSGWPLSLNLNYSVEEARTLCKTDLNFLAALVLGDAFTCDFSPMHLSYWEMLTRDISLLDSEERERIHAQFAFGLPRGFAKTTLLKLYLLWCLLFSRVSFFLVVSAAGQLAENFISDVCGFLDNENIRTLFGNWRVVVIKDTQDLKRFRFQGRDIVLMALGAESSVRGVNIGNARPEILICEDTQSKESANSVTQNESFIKWFLGTLLKTRSPRASQTVYIGNLYNEQCLLYRLRNSAEWVSFIAPAILAGRKSLWPQFRTYESLFDEFRNDFSLGHPEVFLAEVMNDPQAEAVSQVDISKIPAYPFPLNEIPTGKFLTIDPALGLINGNATVIAEHEVIDGKDVVRRIYSGQWNDEQTVEKALIIAMDSGASVIAVEAIAYQASLCNYFMRTLQDKGIAGILIIPIHPRGVPKNKRIGNFIRKAMSGEILIHPDARPAVFFQASRWRESRKDNEDDVLDASAYGETVLQEHWHVIFTTSFNTLEHDSTSPFSGAKVLNTQDNVRF